MFDIDTSCITSTKQNGTIYIVFLNNQLNADILQTLTTN